MFDAVKVRIVTCVKKCAINFCLISKELVSPMIEVNFVNE